MYKFEWNYENSIQNEAEFKEKINIIATECVGWNFEIMARLWYQENDGQKPIMIELAAPTKECLEMCGGDEPIWLDAYEVNTMEDYDCSNSCDNTSVPNITFGEVESVMLEYAKRIYMEE
jgi:hypothetical protein